MGASAAVVVGLVRLRRSGPGPSRTEEDAPATVIVAARNEEAHVALCVEALLGQSHTRLSVIVVDDHSTDGTLAALRQLEEQDHRLRVIQLDSASPSGKKHALLAGIQQAETEILLFTDADCTPPVHWARRMCAGFLDDTAVVAGYGPLQPRRTLFERYTALEAAANAVTASGLIGIGRPMMGTARNLAYRRSAYEAVGGLEPIAHIASGDDTLMIQRLARVGKVRYLYGPETHVPSAPPASFGGWVRQKGRHLSTLGRYNPAQVLAAVLGRSMDILVVVGVPLWALGLAGPAVLWGWGVKAVTDFVSLGMGLRLLSETRLMRLFPLLELTYSHALLLFVTTGLIRRVRWK